MGKGHKLSPNWTFLDERSFQRAGGHRSVMIDSPHLHAHVVGLDDHTNTLGVEPVSYTHLTLPTSDLV